VVVHCVTRKGYGYAPAEQQEADQMHQSPPFDRDTGLPLAPSSRKWTGVFGDELVRLAGERQDVVAVTAAMCRPTGLGEFAARFPQRCYDVGIAEAHAMTSAAGLALGGLHPVVAIYSTFANRAFDQLLLDVALHRLPVTVVLDRAGITGEDGPSHNGVWDLAILGVIPGLRMAAPRDEPTLRSQLGEALQISDGPTVLRFPKTPLPDPIPALRHHPGSTGTAATGDTAGTGGTGGVDVLAEPDPHSTVDVLLVAIGATATDALAATDTIHRAGYTTRVIDPRWHTPVPAALLDLARTARLVVTLEDGTTPGGAGSRISHTLRETGNDVPVRNLGIPPEFLRHGTVGEVRAAAGMTPADIGRRVVEACALVHRSTAGRLTDVSITTMHGGTAPDGAGA
jgi:1-deoxy-D-xylulose-5-phosphate synthase